MVDLSSFWQALSGFGAGAGQSMGEVAQANQQRQFQMGMQQNLFGQQHALQSDILNRQMQLMGAQQEALHQREQVPVPPQLQFMFPGQQSIHRSLVGPALTFAQNKYQGSPRGVVNVHTGEVEPYPMDPMTALFARALGMDPGALAPSRGAAQAQPPAGNALQAPGSMLSAILRPSGTMPAVQSAGEGGATQTPPGGGLPGAPQGMTMAPSLSLGPRGPTIGIHPVPLKAEQPNRSTEQIVEAALEEQLKRKPTNAELDKALEGRQTRINAASGQSRAEAFAGTRGVAMIDTAQGNLPVMKTWEDIKRDNAEQPGRFLPAGPTIPALNKTALIEDIRGAIENTRTALTGLKTDFTAAQAAQISLVMKQRDPRSAMSQFLGSQIGQTLQPEQQDYLVALAQLHENAMAMRSVLGAGQGSDELRAAILRTLPSASTPNRQYAGKQLDAFEAQINRLTRGVPTVPLRPQAPVGGAAPPSGDAAAGGAAKPPPGYRWAE